MINIDEQYWSERYRNNDISWDAGSITTPLKEYFDQLENKNISILIPGAGNSYEAEYLFKQGFTDVTVIDISEEPLKNISNRLPDFPRSKLLYEDFFKHNGKYDLIIEQTFFCAIDPSLRSSYVAKSHSLLREGGKLAGVLFDAPLNTDHPPFGGTAEKYRKLFAPYFKLIIFGPCYNSIKPRAGKELFINLLRR